MKIDRFKADRAILAVLILTGIFYLSFSSQKTLGWDESDHGNAALFFYRTVGHLVMSGFSIDSTIAFAADYHAHYKVFSVVSVYPPLHYILNMPFILIFGNYAILMKMLVVLEAMVLLYFLYRLAALYSKNRHFPTICVLLLALHPVFLDIATRNMLDTGMTMFAVMSAYFFIQFMGTEKRKYLYYTSVSLGLSLLAKPMLPVIVLVMLLTMAFERKLHLFKKHWRDFITAFFLFLLSITPFMAQQAVVFQLMGPGHFIAKWTSTAQTGRFLPSFELGSPIFAQTSHTEIRELEVAGVGMTDFQEFTKNLSAFLFQWYLIPFFIAGVYLSLRRGSSGIHKLPVLYFLVMLYLFSVRVHAGSLKHIILAMPFIALLFSMGFVAFFETGRMRKWKKYAFPALSVILVLSAVQAIAYEDSMERHNALADYNAVASFLIGRTDGPTSVLTTMGAQQIFSFAMLDSERRIYGLYVPYTTGELEEYIAGNFSGYANIDKWAAFGIDHPNPQYIIIHEEAVRESLFEFDETYFTGRPERFELLETFKQGKSGLSTFIFKVL